MENSVRIISTNDKAVNMASSVKDVVFTKGINVPFRTAIFPLSFLSSLIKLQIGVLYLPLLLGLVILLFVGVSPTNEEAIS